MGIEVQTTVTVSQFPPTNACALRISYVRYVCTSGTYIHDMPWLARVLFNLKHLHFELFRKGGQHGVVIVVRK